MAMLHNHGTVGATRLDGHQRSAGLRSCFRCGIERETTRHRGKPYMCADCRYVDPDLYDRIFGPTANSGRFRKRDAS